ncbi:MAG: outer membrane lipoprotein-sorting protein [Pseudomonadota bacterium]
MRLRLFKLGVLLMLAGAQPSLAETPEEKGLRIAIEAETLDAGFRDYVVEGSMTLESQGAHQANREFTLSSLEVVDDGDKRLIVISHPPDVRGTVSLTYTHGLEPDDQWLYLPALRRTKRLSSRDKTGSFIGSEFTFEDLGSYELKKYTYKWLRDEEIDGHDCYVREDTPAYAYSGYARLVSWVDKENLRSRKIVYYDLQDRPLKELRFYDFQQYAGRHWRPDRVVMSNLQNGNVSTIEWTNYRFGTGISERDFAPTRLERVSR